MNLRSLLDEPKQPRARKRGRTGQFGKINRLRVKSRGRSDFVLRAIHIDHLAAVAKAEARQRHGT